MHPTYSADPDGILFSEDDLLPLSALQHLAFCERQWGLIHLEGIWDENPLTMEGNILHDRTDEPETEVRGELRIARALRLRSLRLGLSGKADVVEFHRFHGEAEQADREEIGKQAGIHLEGVSGWWKPFPVEYKRGSPKTGRWDEIQLCGQGLCLEEMLGVTVPGGALFYGKPRRRTDVEFDRALRETTEELARRLHELNRKGETPPAVYEKKCDNCSIQSFCLPKVIGKRRSIGRYTEKLFSLSDDREGDGEP